MHTNPWDYSTIQLRTKTRLALKRMKGNLTYDEYLTKILKKPEVREKEG